MNQLRLRTVTVDQEEVSTEPQSRHILTERAEAEAFHDEGASSGKESSFLPSFLRDLLVFHDYFISQI